jgi:replicative DNA helicase
VSSILLAFSEQQQSAILAYCLGDHSKFDLLSNFGINKDWFSSNSLGEFWRIIHSFKDKYGRYPKAKNEILDFVQDDLNKEACIRVLDACAIEKKSHDWDILQSQLQEWAKAYVLNSSLTKVADLYQRGKITEATTVWDAANKSIQRVEVLVGNEPDKFVCSADQIDGEKVDRLQSLANSIPWGIDFLQDALGNILPSDIILIGGGTGAGKTEFARIVAGNAARDSGKEVFYIALEADPKEIERRILYGKLANEYKKDHPSPPRGFISYRRWYKNELDKELSPYEDKCIEEFKKEYKHLHIFYRKEKDFGIKELERELMGIRKEAQLIVLDHIHYVDVDTTNENGEMLRLIKALRDVIQTIKIPIINVAHLRKGAKLNGLVPDLDSYHGSSNLTKIVNTSIMLAHAPGYTSADQRANGNPTFIRLLKNRIDGETLKAVGLGIFDNYNNCYRSCYDVGYLCDNDNKWKPYSDNFLPYWVNKQKRLVGGHDIIGG